MTPYRDDLASVVSRLLDRPHERPWRILRGTPWHTALPATHAERRQGWQLDVSATPKSVPAMLERVVPVLRAHRAAFTFAPSVALVGWLGGRSCPRADSGKVLTVFPRDDDVLAQIAEELLARTAGILGPRVLSARPVRPGSVVHYRFGGFQGTTNPFQALDDDGRLRQPLLAPDGTTVPDRGEAWFAPPTWAPCPWDGTETAGPFGSPDGLAPGQAIRLHRRYVVRQALEHLATGGSYLAIDEGGRGEAGEAGTAVDVVLRHARAHADADLTGTDARSRLLHEARMLRRLDGHLRVARPRAVFAAAGDVFLVRDHVAGETLRQWVHRHASGGAGVPADLALMMSRRLVALVGAAHGAGVALRDLHPSQFLVGLDGSLGLASAAAATPIGQNGPGPVAPGYHAPDLRTRTAATTTEDLYGLGCLLFLLATGADPLLPADVPADVSARRGADPWTEDAGLPDWLGAEPATRPVDGRFPVEGDNAAAARHEGRPVRDRLSAWLAVLARYGDTARLLRPAITTLLAPRPEERGDLVALEPLLAGRHPLAPTRASDPAASAAPADQPGAEELLADGLDHLLVTMRPDDERLWASGDLGARTDPRNVQHGAAGVLAVLLRAHANGAAFDVASMSLDAAARKAAAWLSDRCERGDRALPGLYYGRAGVAWVLADAAATLGEPPLLAQAERLALRLPTSWPNADIAHGLAGAALTQLYLARAGGDGGALIAREGQFGERALACGRALRAAAVPGPYGPTWPVPASFGSELAGGYHYGFAHGVAGIGYALLALGTALDEPAYVELAAEAGYTLCRAARVDEDGAAWWPVGPEDANRLPHWCSGSSGVGTFLLRLLAVTGEQRFGEYARAAAGAVYRARWRSSPSACHGLAGDGEYLLDAAEILADPTYRAWAEDLVPLLAVRHCRREGRALVPDETLTSVVADYNVGLSGVLAYLMRLRYGGPRLFLVDHLLTDDEPGAPLR
ncbi:class III lanthionine synthetase LanKC N-terminal domain-containing protein [Actinopolymorpha pittospori]